MFNLPQITAEQLAVFLYPTERAQRGSRAKFEAALAKVAATEPDEADRL